MAGSISVSYTEPTDGLLSWAFELQYFTDEDLPRTYQGTAAFNTSANGSSILTGPAFRQKFIWAVSVYTNKQQAEGIDAMYRQWDSDRAAGYTASLGVIDTTFGPQIATSAIISTPPEFTRLSPDYWIVAFGLTEV